ncbi:MAG: hypothetical protein ACE5H7_14430 [Acidiferrobacterales bacterium]
MLRISVVVVVVFLAGCQGYYDRHIYGNEKSPYFKVPVDSRLILNQELAIPANTDRIYFQHGQVRSFQDTNEYLAYCALQIRTRKDTAQSVKPGEFVVEKSYRQTIYQLALRAPLLLAQMDGGGDGVMEYRVMVTIMELLSTSQPDVIRLTCGKWDLPPDAPHITIRDMREELGNIFRLVLADQRTP